MNMKHITGVLIELETGKDDGPRKNSETDDHLYLGFHGGQSGGIEFALWSEGIDNFEKGTTKYFAGIVDDAFHQNSDWHECAVTGIYPHKALFENLRLNAQDINTVYLRKNGYPGHDTDDEYKIKSINVQFVYRNTDTDGWYNIHWNYLAETPPPNNQGYETDGWYLSNETGHTLFLNKGKRGRVSLENDKKATRVEGVLVQLESGENISGRGESQTDDHLYLGFHGQDKGGIEIALWNRDIDNFELGKMNYYAGLVDREFERNDDWHSCHVTGSSPYKPLIKSHELNERDIQTVYLRKNSRPGHSSDDEYKLKSVLVTFIYKNNETGRRHKKTWRYEAKTPTDGWYLSNQTGHTVYLLKDGPK